MRRENFSNIFDVATFALVLFLLLGVFLIPKTILANIIISEINWNGNATSSADEWMELYNTSDEEIVLNNWTINWNDNIINLDEINLASNDYLLLERTDDDTVPSVNANLIYTGSLRNSGEIILLKNNEEIIDTVDFSAGWPETTNVTSTLERDCTDFSIWQISNRVDGSPKQPNTICEQETEPIPEPEPEYNLTISGSSCQRDTGWNCIDDIINLTDNIISLPIGTDLEFASTTHNNLGVIKTNNNHSDITIFVFYITGKVIGIAKNWLFFGSL